MTTGPTWMVASTSNPNRDYTVRLRYEANPVTNPRLPDYYHRPYLSCDCRGWTINRKWQGKIIEGRYCKHTDEIIQRLLFGEFFHLIPIGPRRMAIRLLLFRGWAHDENTSVRSEVYIRDRERFLSTVLESDLGLFSREGWMRFRRRLENPPTLAPLVSLNGRLQELLPSISQQVGPPARPAQNRWDSIPSASPAPSAPPTPPTESNSVVQMKKTARRLR